MNRHNLRLGSIFGIPVYLDYSWFLIFALLTWSFAVGYYPAQFKGWSPSLYWGLGAATAVALFGSVLLHELGHSVVALRYRIPVRSITLFLFGGVAQIGAEPPGAGAEFFVAIAGPAVSFALAALFALIAPAVRGAAPAYGLAHYLAFINLWLGIFNLIPGYPLDGGRVFRAVVWATTGNLRRATLIAANVGRFFGFLFIFAGVWLLFAGDFTGGLWIAFVGWFLDHAASAQASQAAFQGLLAGHTVAQAMGHHGVVMPENLTLQEAVDEHILASGQRAFLVTRPGGEAVGLLTLHRVRDVPRNRWDATRAGEVMLPLDQLRKLTPDTGLWPALQQMDRDGVNQLPVMEGGRVAGMLTRQDVISYLTTLEELGGS